MPRPRLVRVPSAVRCGVDSDRFKAGGGAATLPAAAAADGAAEAPDMAPASVSYVTGQNTQSRMMRGRALDAPGTTATAGGCALWGRAVKPLLPLPFGGAP